MNSGTLLFLLLVVGAPLAMMLMHRGGHAGMGGGCGMGHTGHSRASHAPASPTPVSGDPDSTENHASQPGATHEVDGHGHQRHHC